MSSPGGVWTKIYPDYCAGSIDNNGNEYVPGLSGTRHYVGPGRPDAAGLDIQDAPQGSTYTYTGGGDDDVVFGASKWLMMGSDWVCTSGVSPLGTFYHPDQPGEWKNLHVQVRMFGGNSWSPVRLLIQGTIDKDVTWDDLHSNDVTRYRLNATGDSAFMRAIDNVAFQGYGGGGRIERTNGVPYDTSAGWARHGGGWVAHPTKPCTVGWGFRGRVDFSSPADWPTKALWESLGASQILSRTVEEVESLGV